MTATPPDLTCPDEGRLRAHVDVADPAVAAHVAACSGCATRLGQVRSSARLAARAIAGLDDGSPVDVDAAWAARPRPALPLRPRRWARVTTGVAAAVVVLLAAALVVVTPTGRQAAADFLSRFRAERIELVTFDPEAPAGGLEELARIAEIEVEGEGPVPVAGLDEAAQLAGFDPGPVDGLDAGEATQVMASAPSTVHVTFHADQAPDLPARLDGARLVVGVPGTIVQEHTVDGGEVFVAEAGQAVVEARGADLADVREYLLQRPEVPPSLARQLLAIDDWTATLPLPVPVGEIAWREVTVAGHPGYLLEDTMGTGVLWHDGERVHAVAGMGAGRDVVTRIADGVGG